MQGTALLLLTITISISMLMNSLFYPWKKINSKPRCTLTKKVNKKIQESGCGRHNHFDLWLKHRIVLLSWHNRVQQYPPDIAPFSGGGHFLDFSTLTGIDWLLTVFWINGPLLEVLLTRGSCTWSYSQLQSWLWEHSFSYFIYLGIEWTNSESRSE